MFHHLRPQPTCFAATETGYSELVAINHRGVNKTVPLRLTTRNGLTNVNLKN